MIDPEHQVLSTLGVGGAGEVYSIKNLQNECMYAAKFARKDIKITPAKKLMLLKRERDVMENLHEHPNILTSYSLCAKQKRVPGASKSTKNTQFGSHLLTSPYHLIEYCENGSFISYLRGQDVLDERIVNFYAGQLFSAVDHIHYKGYAHLDIKLDNILLDDYFNIRLSDFGSAIFLGDETFTVHRRGTPKYMAPEVLNLTKGQEFDAYKADIYSLGICLYLMLFKKFPVYKDCAYPATKDLFDSLDTSEDSPFNCDLSKWQQISAEMRRVLIACLHKDPTQRPSSFELCQSYLLPDCSDAINLVFDDMQNRKVIYEHKTLEKQAPSCAKVDAKPEPKHIIPEFRIPQDADESNLLALNHLYGYQEPIQDLKDWISTCSKSK